MAKKRYTSIDAGHQHEYKTDRHGEGSTLGPIEHSHEIGSGVVFPSTDGHTHKVEDQEPTEEE